MPAIEPESNERRNLFDAHVAAKGKVEPQDWMPGAYRVTQLPSGCMPMISEWACWEICRTRVLR